MHKNTEIFGIDISKDVFDVYSHQKGHQSCKNDAQGFKSFLKTITKEAYPDQEQTTWRGSLGDSIEVCLRVIKT